MPPKIKYAMIALSLFAATLAVYGWSPSPQDVHKCQEHTGHSYEQCRTELVR